VSFNAVNTIAGTIASVLSQREVDIEYIIVDGNSKDGTKEIVKRYAEMDRRMKWVSEPDSGLYDAMNKGIRMASGDVVGIINADDFFIDQFVVAGIKSEFLRDPVLDAVYGDVQFVMETNLDKIVRRYSSSIFKPLLFRWGFMPAHPTFYCKRVNFELFGYYRTDFKIAADYELLMRFIYKNEIKTKYISKFFVNMRLGGKSTQGVASTLTINREILKACKLNGMYTNLLMLYFRYLYKFKEFI
jgi:glycosyltransferase involved in cell wall biosynthesis